MCEGIGRPPPEVFRLAGVFCAVDTCEITISYAFVGQTQPQSDLDSEFDLTDVLSDEAAFEVRGQFRFSLRTHGNGASISEAADGFSLQVERGESAHRWQWIGDGDEDPTCTRATSSSPFDPERVTAAEIVDADDRSECAQLAFADVGLGFIDTSDPNAVRLTLSSDLAPSNDGVECPLLENTRQSSYDPFVVFGDDEAFVAADANGWVAWMKAWDDGIQWTLVFAR